MSTRKLVARSILAVLYLGLAVFAFVTGRGHSVYVVNQDQVQSLTVNLGGGKDVFVKPAGVRLVGVAKGQSAAIKVTYSGGGSAEGLLRLPLGPDAVTVTVLGAGRDSALVAVPAPEGVEER